MSKIQKSKNPKIQKSKMLKSKNNTIKYFLTILLALSSQSLLAADSLPILNPALGFMLITLTAYALSVFMLSRFKKQIFANVLLLVHIILLIIFSVFNYEKISLFISYGFADFFDEYSYMLFLYAYTFITPYFLGKKMNQKTQSYLSKKECWFLILSYISLFSLSMLSIWGLKDYFTEQDDVMWFCDSFFLIWLGLFVRYYYKRIKAIKLLKQVN